MLLSVNIFNDWIFAKKIDVLLELNPHIVSELLKKNLYKTIKFLKVLISAIT